MDSKLYNELILNIDQELKDCEETGAYPIICRLKSDPNGYKTVQKSIVKMVVEEGFTIGEAIAQVESSYE